MGEAMMWTPDSYKVPDASKTIVRTFCSVVTKDSLVDGYMTRISILESMLQEQMTYKQDLVKAHIEYVAKAEAELSRLQATIQMMACKAASSDLSL
jgi:hypothetical protein